MAAAKRPKPVMVHINYHPNKEERMATIIEYFKGGNAEPMMKLPGGSEPGT
jgi:arabinosyltransferase